MAYTYLGRICFAFSPTLDSKERVDLMASVMIDSACLAPFFIVGGLMPYGRYSNAKMKTVNARIGWIIQECPSFIIPAILLIRSLLSENPPSLPAIILLSAFLFHYGYRVFVYSYAIRGGKPSPLFFFVTATLFCACNGYMQAASLIHYSKYQSNWLTEWNFILGMIVFAFGLYTNTRCDNILRGLRRPGETGYKVPRGWMFDYVTGGNYFGESLEWTGWALACWSPHALAFAVFATAFLSSRSYSHHKWYLENLKSYPKNRKIFLPFVF